MIIKNKLSIIPTPVTGKCLESTNTFRL